ncbi:TetR/AcrR family transcriptional regulator [Pseudobacteroides cellulosolvens]|uniref:Transcriptional regulator, TetR family n=1 Tax=Pseudobacteroides cellulosolvens ATCC 35603 = DSM 2933 TaxID=398512 RepID=A0A0L6JU89_9FIRM|nr:helix-turn-helix domain-containing protein [Pseudobacteroides cellulosolvens]KNY29388.1 transcriptional regulator, TetR family [Pseudobacteroides cellulosolvens ATCC 35603 = DSM 2933]
MPKTLINIKEDILMVARQLLHEEGYGRLNIRTIAAKCGIATGTLYNYYKSKQEIVGEIMRMEWCMMVRRVDQAVKSDGHLMDKLGIIYNELRTMMDNVHNVWFDTSNIDMSKNELNSIKSHKDELLKGLSDKILILIKDSERNKDYELIADVICKLFVLYGYEGKVEFARLQDIIKSMLV